jgi:GH25 family lysozyme M1 (1,4-beta-N-acetylmuramidase)
VRTIVLAVVATVLATVVGVPDSAPAFSGHVAAAFSVDGRAGVGTAAVTDGVGGWAGAGSRPEMNSRTNAADAANTGGQADTAGGPNAGGQAHADGRTGAGGRPDAGEQGVTRTPESTTLAPADFAIHGIDVSGHDHAVRPIDWGAVAAGGVKFAYIKATEGTTFVNSYYNADYQAARDNGLRVGAYAFGRPDLGDPAGQANHLMDTSLWTVDSQTLIPFLDVEWPYAAIKLNACWGLTPAQMTAWIHGFLDTVQGRIGRLPMIYTNTNWWNPCTGNDPSFGSYALDLAGYTSSPPPLPAGWRNFTLWQYGAGLSSAVGNYDKDVYNGDLPGLATLAAANAPHVISLRAHANGKFVSADKGGRAPLIANRVQIGTWEQFDEVDLGGGDVALRAHANGCYVTADSAGAKPLIANRMVAGNWERFRLTHNPDGSISLRSNVNGRYVTAETRGAAPLVANRRTVGIWEEFDQY